MNTTPPYDKIKETRNESGVVLVAVTCFVAMAAILAAGLMTESSSQLKLSRKNVSMEQSFCVAEGGAERAVSLIRQTVGWIPTTCMTGSIGNGNYMTFITPTPDSGTGNGGHAIGGSLNINPNNSPDHEFLLLKPDGTSITRDDLVNDTTEYDSEPCIYYTGPAMLIHAKPQGAGNQNTLLRDGGIYTLNNSTTYDFVGEMEVVIQNDSRNNGNHRANGQWQVGSVSGDDITFYDSTSVNPTDMEMYEIRSIGTVDGVKRTVILEGVHERSWAEYAMWYNTGPSGIFIGAGDFYGRIHANCAIEIQSTPHFHDLVTSAANGWVSGSDLSQAQFDAGFHLGVPTQTMASINFTNTALTNSCLRALAGLVVTGATSIRLQDTNLFISNPLRGWTNLNYAATNPALVGTGLIYVATWGANTGTLQIAGTNFNGRLTIATDWDILITNHLTYAANPSNSPSDDAIGLLSRHDIYIPTNAPGWLNIFAHLVADGSATTNTLDGKFEVVGWNNTTTCPRSRCQTMTVYGGIVQNYRGYISNGSGSAGYKKNYIYDTRFAENPPPCYPTLSDEYMWQAWRDGP